MDHTRQPLFREDVLELREEVRQELLPELRQFREAVRQELLPGLREAVRQELLPGLREEFRQELLPELRQFREAVRQEVCQDKKRAGIWQIRQRQLYKSHQLTPARILALEATEGWKWEEEDRFEENRLNWSSQYENL